MKTVIQLLTVILIAVLVIGCTVNYVGNAKGLSVKYNGVDLECPEQPRRVDIELKKEFANAVERVFSTLTSAAQTKSKNGGMTALRATGTVANQTIEVEALALDISKLCALPGKPKPMPSGQ